METNNKYLLLYKLMVEKLVTNRQSRFQFYEEIVLVIPRSFKLILTTKSPTIVNTE